jgi:uncharacterized cupin superfamily protein
MKPGHRLGPHTDSAEEILLLFEGEVEATVGDEQGRVSAGEMAVVPAMVPHALRNVGDETVRVVGGLSLNITPRSSITFQHVWMDIHCRSRATACSTVMSGSPWPPSLISLSLAARITD